MFDDPAHRRKVLVALPMVLAALVVVLLAVRYGTAPFEATAPHADDLAARLAYVARWLAIPGLALGAGVVAAARRGFYADAIDGTRTPANHALEINLRYNQNTIEQGCSRPSRGSGSRRARRASTWPSSRRSRSCSASARRSGSATCCTRWAARSAWC